MIHDYSPFQLPLILGFQAFGSEGGVLTVDDGVSDTQSGYRHIVSGGFQMWLHLTNVEGTALLCFQNQHRQLDMHPAYKMSAALRCFCNAPLTVLCYPDEFAEVLIFRDVL